MARQLASRKCKTKAAAVVTDEQGLPLATDEERAERWMRLFFKEFSERGEHLQAAEVPARPLPGSAELSCPEPPGVP